MSHQLISELLPDLDELSDFEKAELLHCRHCQRAITAENFRIQINGAHQHRFSNPSQQVYDVCCFQWAPGSSIYGEATRQHSWFADYRWQFAHCEECAAHLGWYYEHDRHSFFALIPRSLQDVE